MIMKKNILCVVLWVAFAGIAFADVFSPNWLGETKTFTSNLAFQNSSTVSVGDVRINAYDATGTAKPFWVKKEAGGVKIVSTSGEATLKLNGKVAFLQMGTYTSTTKPIYITISR
jgi:hypothetical protein